jgi:GNAT superfamily N-acetyltransferase
MTIWEFATDLRPPTSPTSPISPTTVRPSTNCEIRVLATIAELVESYRLRYEIYDAVGYLQRFNNSRLDIDEYDSSSIPFGAFDSATNEMIGTLRLVTTQPQPDYDYLIRCIISNCGDTELAQQAWGPQPHRLPSIMSDEIDRQIDVFNTGGFDVYEISRCIVRPEHRGSGVWRGLAELCIAHAMRHAPAVFVAGCVPAALRVYAQCGFRKLPNTGLCHFDSVGQLAGTIICRTDVLPQPMRSRVDGLLHSMASGASEHIHELGRDSRALVRLTAPRRNWRGTHSRRTGE